MKPPETISTEALWKRFPPVELELARWPFSISSAMSVVKKIETAIGKSYYLVEFMGGEVCKVSDTEMREKFKDLLDDFNAKSRSNEAIAKRSAAANESNSDDQYRNHNPRQLRLRLRSTSKATSTVVAHSSRETSVSTYDGSSVIVTDSEDDSLRNFIADSDVEDEPAETIITRSQRKAKRPMTFERQYNVYAVNSKVKNVQIRHIPLYNNENFINHHSRYCIKCKRRGQPNGTGVDNLGNTDVPFGKSAPKKRLLLCQNCSGGQHNSCISTRDIKYLIDRETGNFKCQKCTANASCSNCNQSTAKDEKISFRCNTCSRLFHRDCINKNLTSKLAGKAANMDIEEMYSNGNCLECTTYFNELGYSVRQIIADREVDGRKELFVRWHDQSYRLAEWVPCTWIQAVAGTVYFHYKKKKAANFLIPFSEEWLRIDRIIGVEWENKAKKKPKRVLAVYKDSEYADAVWDEPPTEDDPILFPSYEIALKRYILASQVKPPKQIKDLIHHVRAAAGRENYAKHALKLQPEFLKGGTLMQHQMEALNWLLYNWEGGHNCIIADDMGLGKTIQVISYLYFLFKKYKIYPFLIVVPQSTATNWVREFQKWAPELVVVPLLGLQSARDLALKYEILDENGKIKCHAIVSTYESCQSVAQLQKIFWPVLIVDESQRLKNDESQLFQHLKKLKPDHIVLLSGTPLQNNLRELFNMMHFIRPGDFKGADAEDYEELTKEQVEELHQRLRPYFLRRTKEEVLKNLPPKYELIVPLSMTTLQKELYKNCLSKEIFEVMEHRGIKRTQGFKSILMNLRKVLNHPYLLDGIEEKQSNPEQVQRAMIDACSKLKLLHQMLPKLKERGHRTLIFTTMSRVLDIIEDYLSIEGRSFVRIDGSVGERDRVRAIDAFNDPESTIEVFLLTTRAGGVGINLTSADTVIIWDSDWNPYADLQAISRAHRIGQTKMVMIYRFMTRLTVEEKVLQTGKKKMALEHVVVEKMKEEEEDEIDNIENILKFGAEALFSDDSYTELVYDDAAVDKLLDREQYIEAAEEQKRKDIENLEEAKERNTVDFGFAKIWQRDGTTEELPADGDDKRQEADTDFWQKFLDEQKAEAGRKREEKRLAELSLGRGARKRAVKTYKEGGFRAKNDSEDRDFVPVAVEDEEDIETQSNSEPSPSVDAPSDQNPTKKRKRKHKRTDNEKQNSSFNINSAPNFGHQHAALPMSNQSAPLQSTYPTGAAHLRAPSVLTFQSVLTQPFLNTLQPTNAPNSQPALGTQQASASYQHAFPLNQYPTHAPAVPLQQHQPVASAARPAVQPQSTINSQPPTPAPVSAQHTTSTAPPQVQPTTSTVIQPSNSAPNLYPSNNVNHPPPQIPVIQITEEQLRERLRYSGFENGVIQQTNEIWKAVSKNYSVRLASEIFHKPNLSDANPKAIIDEAVRVYYNAAFNFFNLELNKMVTIDRQSGFDSDCQTALFNIRSELTRQHCNAGKVSLVAELEKAVDYMMSKRTEMDLEKSRQAVLRARQEFEEQQRRMQEQQKKMLEEQRKFEEQQRKLQEAMSKLNKK